LPERLSWLGINEGHTIQWLIDLNRAGWKTMDSIPPARILEKLRRFELISIDKSFSPESQKKFQHRKLSLYFVQAINFELTYDCNMNCSHCLQKNLRARRPTKWISTETARHALQDAWFAGLAITGINFTGGEVFVPASNLPELVETARSLDLEVRINTSGWWGNKNNIQVGRLSFATPGHVIEWLRERNIAFLALSFDERYENNPESWQPVASIIRECERTGQNYQIVCTGLTENQLREGWYRLVKDYGIVPRHLYPVAMEMIDIGGAAKTANLPLKPSHFANLLIHSPCEGKGFTRPIYLHVGPDGGVRTCLYSPGSGYLGNINKESLLHITNSFSTNPVASLFNQGDFKAFVQEYFLRRFSTACQIHPGI
jgi:MoaA/NifB/PqqE/SkfB family radical SAM enzyme